MRSPDPDDAPLLALEAAAVPLAFLGAVAVVALGGLASTGMRLAGARFDASATAVEGSTGLVAGLTLLVLAGVAGVAVETYRRRFRRTDSGTQLLVGLFVPVVGVVAPLAYAASELGTLAPPWWLLGVATVAAHAVAFRTVAMYSTSQKHRLRGSAVAAVAALPAAVALTVLFTEWLLAGALADAGGRITSWVDATGVPRAGLLLVVLPIVVAAAYAIYRSHTAPAGSSTPTQGSLPRSSTLPEPSRIPDASLRGAAVSLRDGRAGSLPGVGTLLEVAVSRESAAGSGSGSSPHRPPVSARSSGDGAGAGSGVGSRASGSAGDGGASGRGGSSTGGSSGSDGSSGSKRSSRERSGGSNAGNRGRDRSSSAADGGGPRRVGRSRSGVDDGESTGSDESKGAGGRGSSSGSDATSGGTSGASGSASDAGEEGSGSDTRIFTGSFGSYGDDGDTVERCPACEQTIPSDGVYTFCPFCGQEL